MTFVDRFLNHTSPYESPSSFWRWAAYTTISAILRDNCYRQFGDKRTYPNIYTLVLADSAVHRKGEPVRLCEELVKAVNNTKVISGRSSIQGILDELARGESDKVTGKVLIGGSAIFTASELSAGIVNDPEAVKILTDIYDFKAEYVSRLRGHGVFRIKNICFSMMAASNEELLRDLFDQKAIFGGLLGRTFLVKPNEFRKGNTLFAIRDTKDAFAALASELIEISSIKGEFEFTPEAEKAYEDWYLPFRKSYETRPDKSGIMGRIHTGVIKVAMLICVDRTRALTVTPEHIEESILECMALVPNYTGYVMKGGKSTVSEVGAVLIEETWNKKKRVMSKKEFLTAHFHEFDLEIVDKCVMHLEQAGLIQQCVEGSTIHYMVTQKAVEIFGLKEKEEL